MTGKHIVSGFFSSMRLSPSYLRLLKMMGVVDLGCVVFCLIGVGGISIDEVLWLFSASTIVIGEIGLGCDLTLSMLGMERRVPWLIHLAFLLIGLALCVVSACLLGFV